MSGQDISTVIDDLHQKAMALADEAFYAARGGVAQEVRQKYLAAFELEKAAATLLLHTYDKEPTRSVLFRSAASLLLNLPEPTPDQLREAERMVAYGLCGYPPVEIAAELRDIWQELMTKLQKEAA